MKINYCSHFWKKIDFDLIEKILKNLKYDFTLKTLRAIYNTQTSSNISLFTIRKIIKSHFKLN